MDASQIAQKTKVMTIDDDIAEAERRRRCNQVCVRCLCQAGIDSGLYLFFVDPNDGRRFPTLRFDRNDFGKDGFCVVGSKLYVFEGCEMSGPGRKRVFTFDLRSVSSMALTCPPDYVVRLEKTDFTLVGEMLNTKKYPIPVPTPDGKTILVVSSLINHPPFHHPTSGYESSDGEFDLDSDFDLSHIVEIPSSKPEKVVCPDGVDFELYDTAGNTWTEVPRIPHNQEEDDLLGYALDEERSVFHLRTRVGSFSLELESLKSWGPSSLPRECIRSGRSVLIGDDLCLCARGAVDVSRGGFVKFPLSPVPCRVMKHCVALVGGGEDGECDFCVTRPYRDPETRVLHLIVDFCSLDLARHREDKEIVMRRKRSFEIVVGERPCSLLSSLDLLSMPSSTVC